MTQVPTNDDREEWANYLRAEMNAYKDDVAILDTQCPDDIQKCWLQRVGPTQLGAMLADRQSAERMLSDPDPTLRDVALSVLAYHWGRDAQLAARCEELAVSDPDNGVRSTALHCLSSCYGNTSDSRVGQLLARMVRDEAQSMKVRIAAYEGLFHVRGVPPHLRPISLEKLLRGDQFRFPEDVDWAFVDSFGR